VEGAPQGLRLDSVSTISELVKLLTLEPHRGDGGPGA
jgi:hypothetical protein